MLAWVARGQAGPTPPLVVEVAASVTPCRHPAGPTVLDEHRHAGARGSAAGLGGDVVGADQVPVPLEPAMRAAKLAALGFGDPPVAGGAGRGGASFVHQPNHDPCLFGLVTQGLHKVGAAPPPQPEVVHPAHLPASDPFGIANQQGADALLDGEGDDLLGGLVLAWWTRRRWRASTFRSRARWRRHRREPRCPGVGTRLAALACRAC
jgi:hypothetical protein